MNEYSPGMRLVIRNEEWMVTKVETNSFFRKTIYAKGVSKLVKDRDSVFLTDLEKIEVVDPTKVTLVADDSPRFIKSRLFIESQLRQKIPTDSVLHIGDKAAMDLMPFQLEPALIALKRPRQRILIADTVGLGKTLEAGILMSELIARGKGKRILVVTVKSMMMQFQKEMWNRFTIPLVRLDSSRIQKIRSQIPSNYSPFLYFDRTIISVDTLKRDVEYRTHLEKAWWDIIVIDEAHNVAERGGKQAQRAKLAQLLSGRSDTLIMLSATPHDGKPESFASLMNMLDRTAIADPHNYTKEDIQGLCVRRFKKDVLNQIQGSFKERVITIEKCDASLEEEHAFNIFTDMKLDMDKGGHAVAGQLFKTSLEKALFSSHAACIKSIDERVKKLEKKYDVEFSDIHKLNELREALEKISPSSFSRYKRVLDLLKSNTYAWSAKKKDDRIVIFTERIETMKYLATNLRKDLQIKEDAVQELYGGMSDTEQQRIVEEFGRDESPIRILVASDVASEGINLHYLSHRLIHFDIPWSLMVFQQRNGRIDRYGQTETPDIRYMLIKSSNDKIKGDMRIMEILVTKEEQALKNIGDPAVLMGKFNAEEEELVTAAAIENELSGDVFDAQLEATEDEFDPFELLIGGANDVSPVYQASDEKSLFSNLGYLENAMIYYMRNESYDLNRMKTVDGIEMVLSSDLKKRFSRILPEEAMPGNGILRLCTDKQVCMNEMKKSLKNELIDAAWPSTQYLWAQHPIFSWISDKASILFGRQEAPIITLPRKLGAHEYIFLVAGLIPNRKSTPVVDEWNGLLFRDGFFVEALSIQQVMDRTGIDDNDIPNETSRLTSEIISEAQSLLLAAISKTNTIFDQLYSDYKGRIDPQINEELDKLASLQSRHREYVQLSFENLQMGERKKDEVNRKINHDFEEYTKWVTNTLEIEDKPYIRVVAVLAGVFA